ncbi:MAG TPA: hypothetical protein VF753_20500 [Terriglobales bacterium]
MGNHLEKLVENTVSQVLDRHVAQAKAELVQRVLEEVQAEMPASEASSGAAVASLLQDIQTIHAGKTQKEVLRALLDATIQYSGRSALFVVKSGAATGWQARGFEQSDAIKDFPLDLFGGAPSQLMARHAAIRAALAEMDAQFVGQFGTPAEDKFVLAPLHLKEKIAAIVYADGGAEAGKLNADAVELLVAATSAWLEVAALRKQAAKDEAENAPAESAEPAPAPAPQAGPSYNDPFAGHVPHHASPAVPAESVEPAPSEPEMAPVAAVASASAAAAPAMAVDPLAQLSPEDAEIHRKARRFARLLMDEVKLYNQAKVSEGRKHKDLYDRLRDDIEKSKAAYQKRYGQTAAASVDYFTQELVASLAGDDPSVLGPNFHP